MAACHILWQYRSIGQFGNFVAAACTVLSGFVLVVLGMAGPLGYIFVGAGALFAVMTLLRDVMWRRYYRGLVKYTDWITATVSAEGVGVVSVEAKNLLPWSTFSTMLRTEDYLFIILNQRQFSIIPMAAFQNSGVERDFESIVSYHLPLLKRRYF